MISLRSRIMQNCRIKPNISLWHITSVTSLQSRNSVYIHVLRSMSAPFPINCLAEEFISDNVCQCVMAQRTLAYFGFSKTVSHRGHETQIAIPDTADTDDIKPKIPCRDKTCKEVFKTAQARSQHEVWKLSLIHI